MNQRAMTLVEVVIAIALCAVVFGPIYTVFTSSRKNVLHAQGTSIATSHASSLIAALKQIDYKDLSAFDRTNDTALPAPYSLADLGISPMPKNYTRTLQVEKIDTAGKEGGPYFLATVEVSWKPRSVKKNLTYQIMGFLNSRLTLSKSEE